MHIDVHQHFWPDRLVEALRRRSQPPRLDGWTLATSDEPPFEVNPADHDAARRAAQTARRQRWPRGNWPLQPARHRVPDT